MDTRERDIRAMDIGGERHRGDYRYLPIHRVAAAPHQHPKNFRLPPLLAKLAPLGEVFAASKAPKT